MVPNVHCRVPLRAPISELNSWDFVHAKNGLTRPKRTTESKVRKYILILVLMRIAAFFCVRRYQNWIPEILNHQKMVSHAQIGLQRPEIAFSLLYRGKCNRVLPVLPRTVYKHSDQQQQQLISKTNKYNCFKSLGWPTMTFVWSLDFYQTHREASTTFLEVKWWRSACLEAIWGSTPVRFR